MKNRSKNIKLIACIVSVISILSVTGIFAYFTDIETSYNQFTVGAVRIEIEEPHWTNAKDENGNSIPDTMLNLAPNTVIQKDPQIKNTGENDAYVYFKVIIPVRNIATAQEDGTPINNGNPQDTQLFTYTINDKWIQIGEKNIVTNISSGEAEYYEYVYYFNEKLTSGSKTQSLFGSIKFANIIDDSLELDTYQIDLEAYAIQANNLPENTTIEGAYDMYLGDTN